MQQSFWKLTGIKKKLIGYYLVITMLMWITSLFSYYNARLITTRLDSVFVDYIYLNQLYSDINSLEIELEKYLSSKSSEALLNYYTLYNKLSEQSSDIEDNLSYNQDDLMLKDIGNMISGFLSEADAAINAKRGRMSNEYIQRFTRSNEISEYIKSYINNLLYSKLHQGSIMYRETSRNMAVVNYINIILLLGSLAMSIFLAVFFSYKLAKPLILLARSAEKVSRGDFDIQPLKVNTRDEVSILANAFNKMTVNIREYITKIKVQAEIEHKLKEQEMQNLKMKSILKEAELKALQSQINPHFLFNTLNAASQLAMMEGADKSSKFIKKTADLFRHNLRQLTKPVKLAEEVNSVMAYIYILETRFGDRLKFSAEIDDKILETEIPCIIIQPLVENAYIHGIGELEQGGRINLTVKGESGYVLIEVSDNGAGMVQEKIEQIMAVDVDQDLIKGHVTGIGLKNVIERLRLFYNIPDVHRLIEIQSELNKGTTVILKIPLKEEARAVG
ncbi:histidine kinase [Microaerobacter geothermalis]|nr:histidine kinase [Microaerobacter geothermalis]